MSHSTKDLDIAWSKLLREQAFVNGKWIGDTASQLSVVNPSTRKTIGTVPSLDASYVDEAVRGATEAFPAWRRILARERGELLMRWHDLILANADSLAALMTAEQGKPLSEAQGEIAYGAGFISWFAEEGKRAYGDVIPSHLPDRKLIAQLEPLGPVALVTPWNFPSAMLTRKAAAALAAGCTTVCVPSSDTPYSALALAALAEQAGFPEGVFSVLTGDPATLVNALCADPRVRGLSFTGSTRVGRLLLERCAPTIKRVSLELGGHAPFIVFADADPETAAKACVNAKFQTSGQDCLAANRIFVHRDIEAAFTQAFVRETKELMVGDGFAPGCQIGPLINETALAKVSEQVDDALAKGARLACGGQPDSAGELFYQPTVLAGASGDMRIFREETFGPVAAVTAFDAEQDVIADANNTEYGLIAYVFTNDLSLAWRMTDALEFGMVAVNTVQVTGPPIPFGGIKQSGLGREGSRHGINEYLELKYVCMGIEPAPAESRGEQ